MKSSYWQQRKREYHILRAALSRFFRPYKRTEEQVKEDYEKAYTQQPRDIIYKGQRFFYHGNVAYMPGIGYKKYLMAEFSKTFNSLRSTNVLELGCGKGLNLLTLAVLCPSLRFLTGIELSAKAVALAAENIKNPPIDILTYMTGRSEIDVKNALKGIQIEVVQGSIRKLPFEDKSFDAVFSNSVIEQVPEDFGVVFEEAARVSTRLGVFSEPFSEAQQSMFRRLYLKNIDYFRESYQIVENHGWRIADFKILSLQKYEFDTGFLTCLVS